MRKAVWLCAILISAVMLLCLSACEKESGADVSGPANGETAAENAAEPDDGAPDPAEAGDADEKIGEDSPDAAAEENTGEPAVTGDREQEPSEPDPTGEEAYLPESAREEMQMENIPETAEPAVPVVVEPVADGEIVYGNSAVTIDASHASDGYVMIRYTEETSARVKALVTFPEGTTYQYNLTPGAAYAAFPLSGGTGQYQIGIYKNVEGTKYTTVYTTGVTAEIADEFAPFLQPNQYVNYSAASSAIWLAAELSAGLTDELDIVREIYTYVITNISYDFDKAASVKSGYLPDIDEVLETGKGICFDYAALMTAMLRCREIPTKLVVGYTGEIYHAWISVYTKAGGWMDSVIFFDGTAWKLMDPTFASSGNSSEEMMAYIGNTANYSAKYLY